MTRDAITPPESNTETPTRAGENGSEMTGTSA